MRKVIYGGKWINSVNHRRVMRLILHPKEIVDDMILVSSQYIQYFDFDFICQHMILEFLNVIRRNI